ncbi:MAG: hypothetical protein PF489_11720 [Salinivirgaceae bacterium]|nr:hypothetical protein [Salinivirgaceae bacterium]
MRKLLILSTIFLLLFGCAANRYAKRATKFEDAGLYKDAAEMYYQSVSRNQNKVDPKLGLQRTGQMVLNDMLNDFNKQYENSNTQDAVYHFIEAKDYFDKLEAVNITLIFPDKYNTKYTEVKNSYSADRYREGKEKLNREEFDRAAEIFGEILTISTNYKDAKELYTTAKYEPLYRQANQMLNAGKYRSAYWEFNAIMNETNGYKDTYELKLEAQEKANMNILVPEIIASSSAIANKVPITTTQIVSTINKKDNPFITIVDQSVVNKNKLYSENHNYDFNTLDLMGINAILHIEIDKAFTRKGSVNVTDQPAYVKIKQQYTDENGNKQTKTIYNKTQYKAYSQKNSAELTVSYKLISTKNGAVLITDSFKKTAAHHVEYGRYSGKLNNIVAGYWKDIDKKSNADRVQDNYMKNRNLRNFLTASDKITPTSTLLKQASDEAVADIVRELDTFNPE